MLEAMLNVKDWADSSSLYPTLTEEEVDAYKRRDGSFVLSASEYRIDFKRPWKKFSLNKEAREIFIDKYLARIAAGAFFKNPTPPHLLTHDNIGEMLDKHMPYCRKRWRQSAVPLTPDQVKKILRQKAQVSRMRTVSTHVTHIIVPYS